MMKLKILASILLVISFHCHSQNDLKYIMEFEKIKGDHLSFTGTTDSLVWQQLISSDNKFKIKKEPVANPNYYQNNPVILQFGFIGTVKTNDESYVLTFNFPSTDRKYWRKYLTKIWMELK